MNDFINYLTNLSLSKKSLKNYKSDIGHFTGWIILKARSFGSYIESLEESFPFLNSKIAEDYKKYMLENNVPAKTINRRLSTLRHLARHLIASQIVDFDFTQDLQNISQPEKQTAGSASAYLINFRTYLEHQKISKNTVKNYTSDVRQFLSWLENNQEHAQQTS